MTDSPESQKPRTSVLDTLAVYLKARVLIVLFLGFSAGLPLALSGSTLLFWAAEVGVNLKTIGLFALVGTPYTLKFLWAPIVDALDVPILARLLGRRRGWLIFSQLLLISAIMLLAFSGPNAGPIVSIPFGVAGFPLEIAVPLLTVVAATFVAAASATQDIVIDAFRIESLDENEQAAGMASYVAAYRVGMLVSSAGALYVVSGFEALGFTKSGAWSAGYVAMAVLVVIGILTTLIATEPDKSGQADAAHERESPLQRLKRTITGAFTDFFQHDGVFIAIVALIFVVLFKLTDALAGVMTGPFAVELGFTRTEYANIVKGVGLIALLAGGFAGGYIARALPLAASLWIGGILQSVANLSFSWLALAGHDLLWLTVAITVENFTSAIGTVMFVAYLSALCRNPLHTATQYALLTALAAIGRTYLSAGAGYLASETGWAWFFVICALAGIPSLLLLAWLQARGHFSRLELKKP